MILVGTDSSSYAITRYLAECPEPRLSLRRVRLSGDYETGSRGRRYWGAGEPLYRAETTDGDLVLHTRAASRDEAKRLIAERVRGARFTR